MRVSARLVVTPTSCSKSEPHGQLFPADLLTRYLRRIAETLPQEVLDKMYAPPKDAKIPTIDDPTELEKYDAFLLGIPTRYGNFPAQWKVRTCSSCPVQAPRDEGRAGDV